ncbi:Not3-domain-containing protein [Yamadazyma tenuis ATCC 10573]|uniref:Not3-domain-containing protein n=1 Tax=Candida tenuis (strain ATCC 10573 / BCRC 21748 / CBS 615 / JCM 9827 / NBRC 10315 / NRRL Y-1498 / VKM Y-70) TaxID=590646 RepID=G3AYE1_CANTC|nr:Not3-domain-containing protein [Yamadazyma tenuis ATCC 10573]EGV65831.1 Not3-domain-containing protein [Yamadazyma tenuis ATCC 10573]
MSSRKLQKEIENTFKKINEGLESFNYHYERHQDLNGQVLDRNLESQKEKLETDLKREIKKLQKNRELIKNWQSNDSVEVVVTRNKLQEYRRFVEEAMEKYKEVEKSSKMKSFSNQSIMLATLEDSQHLTKEAIEVIGFLEDSIEEINQQIETLEADYEKISSRKTKKNSSVESEKQEIETSLSRNRFHLESFEKIIDFVKQRQIDPELVVKIQDDINFYLESNQEPDFIDDEALYDEIIQQAESKYTYVPKQDENTLQDIIENYNNESNGQAASGTTQNSNANAPAATIPTSKKQPQIASKSKSPTPITPTKKSVEATTPIKNRGSTPDIDIVQKLKPAATPSKVSGEVAWSSVARVNAAVAGISAAPSSVESERASLVNNGSNNSSKKTTNDSSVSLESGITDDTSVHNLEFNGSLNKSEITNELLNTQSEDPIFPYVKVLVNSGLSSSELKVCSDYNLTKVPPGIQSLILSFTSTRNIKSSDEHSDYNEQGKLLHSSPDSDQLFLPIRKPYIPIGVQNSYYQHTSPFTHTQFVKPPLHLLTYQNTWDKIRATGSYDLFVSDILGLIENQKNAVLAGQASMNMAVVNELMMAFFYGFFYGLTPLENLLAESKLFQLGWKPYTIKAVNQLLLQTPGSLNSDKYYYWVRNMKSTTGTQEQIEFGDYQIFDLSSWEIHLKLGFRLDNSLAESNPMPVLA